MTEEIVHTEATKDLFEKIAEITAALVPGAKKVNKTMQPFYEAGKLHSALKLLTKVVSDLSKAVQDQAQDLSKAVHVQNDQCKEDLLVKRLREHEDEIDNQKQRNLKGKIIISSNAKGGLKSDILTDEEISKKGSNLPLHVVELADQKYKVELETGDFSCYRLKNGGISVTFWNKWPGSAFQRLATAIKTNTNFVMNVYFNFMLTYKRSNLLFEIRKLKNVGKVNKFYSDEDGVISIKINNDNRSKKVTNIRQENSSFLKTLTVEELVIMTQ